MNFKNSNVNKFSKFCQQIYNDEFDDVKEKSLLIFTKKCLRFWRCDM